MNTDILIASLGVFLGELYGNMVGGGSLLTQAVLQNILHFDIKTALALDNAAVIGANLGMILILRQKYKIKWWFYLFTIFQILGAILGAWILIKIPAELLKLIFITAILSLIIKNLFFSEKKHHEKGFKENWPNLILLSVAAIFTGAYNAAFVIGDWIIALLILTNIFAIKYQRAIFLLVFSMLFSQPFAAYKYYINGLIDFNFLVPMILATFIGGMISAFLLHKIHSKKLEIFLKYLSVGLVIYLILNL